MNQNGEQITVTALESFGFSLKWPFYFGSGLPFFLLLAQDTGLAVALLYSELALMMSAHSLE